MVPPDELQKKVVGLSVVMRPLQSSRNAGKTGNVVPHKGCVATTGDGDKYLIEKGVAPDELEELYRIGGDQGSRIVKIGSKLPYGFQLFKKVTVINQDATLLDLLEACGKEYHWLCNNCWNSTQNMQQVVSNDLGLPWQFEAGMKVGAVAVIAMLLLITGRLHRI